MKKLRYYLATCWFFLREICVYKRTNGKTNLCEQKILFDQLKLQTLEE
jgi:hypothetical protein